MAIVSTSYRILIVDDEPRLLRTLRTYLQGRGYVCETTDNPVEALERLRDEVFHIVLTDLRMPELDGLELVRRAQGGGNLAFVIVMTAYGSPETVSEAYRMGVSDYLIKPFESLSEVGRVLGQASDRLDRWRRALEGVPSLAESLSC